MHLPYCFKRSCKESTNYSLYITNLTRFDSEKLAYLLAERHFTQIETNLEGSNYIETNDNLPFSDFGRKSPSVIFLKLINLSGLAPPTLRRLPPHSTVPVSSKIVQISIRDLKILCCNNLLQHLTQDYGWVLTKTNLNRSMTSAFNFMSIN